MRYLRLVAVFLRISVMGELTYRANFVVQLLQSVITSYSIHYTKLYEESLRSVRSLPIYVHCVRK